MSIEELAASLRITAADIVQNAGCGHLGMPLGMADVAATLFSEYFVHRPTDPEWRFRDRFVLSVGHGTPLLYAMMHLTGYNCMPVTELKKFRRLGSMTPGHPETTTPGVDCMTGALGQGVGVAVGLAIGIRNADLTNPATGRRPVTFCMAGDGCLMEGISYEAASLAGHLGLGQLVLIYDANETSIDGSVDLSFSENVSLRFEAANWHVESIDGHSIEQIRHALHAVLAETSKPSIIIARTKIGAGTAREGDPSLHAGPLDHEDYLALRSSAGWSNEPFDIPESIRQAWTVEDDRAPDAPETDHSQQAHWTDIDLASIKKKLLQSENSLATRAPTADVLVAIRESQQPFLFGSADVTISNFFDVPTNQPIGVNRPSGNYIHFGVREHAMVAILNGIARSREFRAVGGTYLSFLDYAKPALRMAAMMKCPIIVVATHDSISAGDDGPTHQPVEQLAGLRATPNLMVFRPADDVEAVECWELALATDDAPSVLALTAHGRPATDDDLTRLPGATLEVNRCSKGAYVVKDCDEALRLTFLATGSEVGIALDAQKILHEQGISTRVVSMPCFELFDRQSEDYRASVLGTVPRVAIEAGSAFGWQKYVGLDGAILSVDEYGESADWKTLYSAFGLDAVTLVAKAKSVLQNGR
jgi:transketolase